MSPQRIYINGRFMMQSLTGVQRYAMELVKSIDRLVDRGELSLNDYEFIVLAPRGHITHPMELKHIEVKQVGWFTGHLWEQVILPFYTWNGFLLNPSNTAPIVKRNQAVTMHDAAVYAVPQTYSFIFKLWYKIVFRILGVTSKQILTCSLFSQKQLMHYYKIRMSKIQTIYHGKEHMLETAIDTSFTERKQLDRPFVLAVSSKSPNKNFHSIVEAIELIGSTDYDIVIAGGSSKIFKSSDERQSSGVKYLGYVEEEELRALYDQASCFVFPSFYEGFGFPALEAMACGCPVIASNAASIPEVCGDAVLYCDPHSPQDIADKIERLMGDSDLREQLRQKGLKQAEQFSWDQCAKETMAILRKSLPERGTVPESKKSTVVGAMARK